ncbi:MAG: hypothetical protein KDB27_11845 [Planctomycetales bacterium]|nr:hypothetical protein [Planctomycetales bacterium]
MHRIIVMMAAALWLVGFSSMTSHAQSREPPSRTSMKMKRFPIADADHLKSQPSGDAGKRIASTVIGIAKSN